jgi:glycerophosphoryl diester phosphodiesterase
VASQLHGEPNGSERILLSSFSNIALHTLTRLLPNYSVGWLVHKRQWFQKHTPAWRWRGFVALHPEHTLVTGEWLSARKGAGAIVNAWTVNDLERAKYLADLGVDGIISDEPRLIVEGI